MPPKENMASTRASISMYDGSKGKSTEGIRKTNKRISHNSRVQHSNII